MADARWRVAVIDSGFDLKRADAPRTSRRFVDSGESVSVESPIDDPTGHGTAVADIIRSDASEILAGQVVDDTGRSTPAAVAKAVRWALAEKVHLIHLSLGVVEDRPVLAKAIGEAVTAGAIVVAAVPARGEPPFPAKYPGVIRATGDARCSEEEVSLLDASVGGCAIVTTPSGRCLRGASIGAAHVSRFIVAHFFPGEDTAIGDRLARAAAYRGREKRSLS